MKTSALEFFNKVVESFIKKRLQHRCFPLDIAIFLRTPILKNIYKRLLLMGLWCDSLALRWKLLTIITKSSILDVAAILEYHSHKNTIVIRTEESLSVLMTMIIHYKELVNAQQRKRNTWFKAIDSFTQNFLILFWLWKKRHAIIRPFRVNGNLLQNVNIYTFQMHSLKGILKNSYY